MSEPGPPRRPFSLLPTERIAVFNNWPPLGSVLLVVVAVWLIYLSIEVARHVGAWPFG